jgi:ribosomal-protein-alanine N-acetyltransferase
VIHPEAAVEIRYRPMQLADVEQVYGIDVLSFPLPWSERSYRFELTENPTSRNWVAEAFNAHGQTQVVAMIVVWVILDDAHVATIAVHPDYRRRGIGQCLLARALMDAAERGVIQVYLEVRRGNLAAQAIYERFGFEVTGVRTGYYRDNSEDALLMTLNPIRIDVMRLYASSTGGQPQE